jgi:hypothetical protein
MRLTPGPRLRACRCSCRSPSGWRRQSRTGIWNKKKLVSNRFPGPNSCRWYTQGTPTEGGGSVQLTSSLSFIKTEKIWFHFEKQLV